MAVLVSEGPYEMACPFKRSASKYNKP